MRTLEELRCALVVDEGAYIDEARAVVRDLIAHVARQAEQIATLTARVEALEASEAERAIDRMVARRTGPGRPMVSAGKVQTPAKLDEVPVAVPGDPTVRHVVAWMRATYPQNAHAQEWAGEIERVFLSHAAPPPPAAPAPASDQAVTACCVLIRACAQRLLDEGDEFDPLIAKALNTVADQIAVGDWREHLAAPRTPAAPAPASDAYEALAERAAAQWGLQRGVFAVSLAALLRGVADEARSEERAACEAVCREVAEECRAIPGWGAKAATADECADRIAARGKGE